MKFKMINFLTELLYLCMYLKRGGEALFSQNIFSLHIQDPPKVPPLSMHLGNELELWKTEKHLLTEFEEDHL